MTQLEQQMVAVLRAFIVWKEKVDGDEDYLNGDSDKNPGDAWDHLDLIAHDARLMLTKVAPIKTESEG